MRLAELRTLVKGSLAGNALLRLLIDVTSNLTYYYFYLYFFLPLILFMYVVARRKENLPTVHTVAASVLAGRHLAVCCACITITVAPQLSG